MGSKARDKWGGFPDAWKRGAGAGFLVAVAAFAGIMASFVTVLPFLFLLDMIFPKQGFTADFSMYFWTGVLCLIWVPCMIAPMFKANGIDLSPLLKSEA